MKKIDKTTYHKRTAIKSFVKNLILSRLYQTLILQCLLLLGCTKFVEVDPPQNILIAETVFEDPATVESAMANLYYNMREQGMVSGNFGLTPTLGIYADELDYYGFNVDLAQFYNHNIIATNNRVELWWNQAYNLIYGANAIIEGVESSKALSSSERNRFKGEALFIRSYMHSQLVGLFGDVPYIKTTDYEENNRVSRLPEAAVYDNIIVDLEEAVRLLEEQEPVTSNRVIPDAYAAKALLARMHLYVRDWEQAVSYATDLMENFQLEMDLDRVFLKASTETIWQLQADDQFPINTREGGTLTIELVPGQTYALTEELLSSFEEYDLRYEEWTEPVSDTDNTITFYYPHKYKAHYNETESLEYSILFRLAEQYLIRAEARARLGNLIGAANDLNQIRERAGLASTQADTQTELLEAIQKERQLELFTEQGHRWFDLKRTGNAGTILDNIKPNWNETNLLLPIPESQLELNPNLLPQNAGY
ncbi:RagB/SusD family nutrient uptake outer membrane protein [Flagellimonas marinaquae]